MTTFKDLFLPQDLTALKERAIKTNNDNDHQHEKPTNVSLPNQQHIAKQVKKLGVNHVDEDKVLFMQAMSGVRPIKANTVHIPTKQDNPNASVRRAAATGEEMDDNTPLSDMQALLNPVASEAYLSYKQPTLQNKSFEQLKAGKLSYQMSEDLHALSIDQARTAVIKAINDAQKNNENVIKIIHGKGDSLIKTCVNGWLRQIDEVMAFVSAPAKDGGTGAVLVLLKRKNKTP